MNPKPPSCAGCPAEHWGQGWVPPEVPTRSVCRLAIVGQGPGEVEARTGQPFHPEAPAGGTLTEWLHRARILRSELLITNIVWCWLPEKITNGVAEGNREPTLEESQFCYDRHLGPLLTSLEFNDSEKVIVAVGAPAARLFLAEEKVEKYMGTFNQRELPSAGD